MAEKDKLFQPGAILHEVIDGVFRSSGRSFQDWCRENKVNPSTARNATYGQSGGDQGRKLLDRIINAAGRETVTEVYRKRMILEADKLGGDDE